MTKAEPALTRMLQGMGLRMLTRCRNEVPADRRAGIWWRSRVVSPVAGAGQAPVRMAACRSSDVARFLSIAALIFDAECVYQTKQKDKQGSTARIMRPEPVVPVRCCPPVRPMLRRDTSCCRRARLRPVPQHGRG